MVRIFSDVDELAAQLTSCNAEFCIRTPSPRPSTVVIRNVGDVQFQLSCIAPAITATGTLDPGVLQIAIPLGQDDDWYCNGQPFDRRHVSLTGNGNSFVARTEGAVRLLSVHVPWRDWLTRRQALQGNDSIEVPHGVRAPAPARMASVYQTIFGVLRFAFRFPQLAARPGVNKVAMGPLLDQLIGLIEPDQGADAGRSVNSRLVRRLEEYLHTHTDEALCLSDLCVAMGASERTLRNLFHRVYGASPTRYLRLRRLNHAHRALREGNAQVTEVALRHGFFDFGRFSAAYRQVFGEYPSETFRASRAKHATSLSN